MASPRVANQWRWIVVALFIVRDNRRGAGEGHAHLTFRRRAVLDADVRAVAGPAQGRHWFAEIGGNDGGLGPLELIQHESLFASMGNFCIGGSFATQQTPYADRTVIVQKLREPVAQSKASPTPAAMRIRDLKHRFLGDPVEKSFQRKLVVDVGGVVARSPGRLTRRSVTMSRCGRRRSGSPGSPRRPWSSSSARKCGYRNEPGPSRDPFHEDA